MDSSVAFEYITDLHPLKLSCDRRPSNLSAIGLKYSFTFSDNTLRTLSVDILHDRSQLINLYIYIYTFN